MDRKLALLLLSAIAVFGGFGFLSQKSRQPQKEVPLDLACNTNNFTGLIEQNAHVAFFEGKNLAVDSLALAEEKDRQVLGVNTGEKWIEVDLSDQKLYAWEGNNLFMQTAVSTGLPNTPTPKGEFRIWIKLRATKMEGGTGRGYYNLPNVPYVMFFGNADVPNWKGYGLHGTYWHSDFGTPRSHGCVNLPTEKAKDLYLWTTPVLPDGKSVVKSSNENLGTRVVIHD